jgi:hypothetical protein
VNTTAPGGRYGRDADPQKDSAALPAQCPADIAPTIATQAIWPVGVTDPGGPAWTLINLTNHSYAALPLFLMPGDGAG